MDFPKTIYVGEDVTNEKWFKDLPITEQGIWREILKNYDSGNEIKHDN